MLVRKSNDRSNMWKLFILVFISDLLYKSGVLANVNRTEQFYQEVPIGQTVVLTCKSSDQNHTFEFWIFDDDVIIGPSNENFDNKSFEYEAVSGNLTIRAVSKELEGSYACISKNVNGEERQIERIKIIVEQDWEDVYEHDSNINLIRILIIVATLVLVAIGGYVIFRMWKERYQYPSYLGHEDDGGSTEEIYRSPTTSGMNRSRSPRRIVLERSISNPLDGDSVSTDFKSILERTNS